MVVNHIPVDVISVCSADGEIRPLRIRLQDEHQNLIKVNIDEIVSTKQLKYTGVESMTFLCRAMVDENPRLFELRYSIRSHSWSVLQSVY